MDSLNKLFEQHYPRLSVDIPKQYPRSKDTITVDLSDLYVYLYDRNIIPNCLRSMAFRWVYNRHYVYNKAKPTLELDPNIQLPDYDQTDYLELLDTIQDRIDNLDLASAHLYRLYFIDKLSTRKIGKHLGCSHTLIAAHINKMKQKIKNSIEP